jgi:hypothetical protein
MNTTTFINNFFQSLAIPIGDLAKWLEKEHQVPISDTIEKWNELSGMQVIIDDNTTTCEEVNHTTTIKIKTNDSKNNGLISTTCQHVFVSGNRKGQQCTTKPKGGDRCSAHKLKIKKDSNSGDDEPTTTTVKKRPIKKNKSKKKVNTDSESETPKKSPVKSIFDTDSEDETPYTTKPAKKNSMYDSELESEDENSTSKKKLQKKVQPLDSEDDDN